MNAPIWRLFAGQLVGRAIVLALGWYWLSLGVGTQSLVVANALLAMVIVTCWSLLDAWGLGQRRWYWALLLPVCLALSVWHPVAAIAGVVFGVGVLLPSMAAGRWTVCHEISYWGRSLVYLLVLLVAPVLLLRWVPSLEGLGVEGLSFALRAGFGFLIGVGAWTLLLRHASNIATARVP